MIGSFRHVGISVVSLERSVPFYRDVLGMRPFGPSEPFSGERYASILQLPGARGRLAILEAPGLEPELFEFARPAPRPQPHDRPVCDHGITHICIEVQDIESVYIQLLAAGVTCHCPPLEFPGIAIATYARDPDGNVIEITQKCPNGESPA